MPVPVPAGEYQCPLVGRCIPPKPQGPIDCSKGSGTVQFKNVFTTEAEFLYSVDNSAFQVGRAAIPACPLPALPRPTLSCPTLPCPALPCPALSCLTLPRPVLPCPAHPPSCPPAFLVGCQVGAPT